MTFAKKLSFLIKLTDIRVKKIDGTTLDTYKIVVTAFLVTNKENYVRFFQKIFLIANVSPKIIFRMFFFFLSDVNIDFLGQKL